MISKQSLLGVVAFSVLTLASVAQAQNTRAEVKADAAFGKANQPVGQMSVPNQDKGMAPKPSAVSREEVKAETLAAEKAGTIVKGEQSTPRQGKKPPHRRSSTETRAHVKSHTSDSNKQPTGQASQKDQDKGVTKP